MLILDFFLFFLSPFFRFFFFSIPATILILVLDLSIYVRLVFGIVLCCYYFDAYIPIYRYVNIYLDCWMFRGLFMSNLYN